MFHFTVQELQNVQFKKKKKKQEAAHHTKIYSDALENWSSPSGWDLNYWSSNKHNVHAINEITSRPSEGRMKIGAVESQSILELCCSDHSGSFI